MFSRLWPLILKCFPTSSLVFFFGLYSKAVVIDSSPVSPTYCFEQTFAADKTDAVVCAVRRVAKCLVGPTRDGAFKTVLVGVVVAQKVSDNRSCFHFLRNE